MMIDDEGLQMVTNDDDSLPMMNDDHDDESLPMMNDDHDDESLPMMKGKM